jgi:hypothetical protein
MTTQTTKTTLNIGEVSNATELVFRAGNDDRRYLLQLEGVDYLETLERYSKYDVKRTTHYYIDDTDGQWFACYNVDCFDPPMAIVRARSFESAYEVFCDEFERWLKVNDTDAADYPEDDRQYNGSGTHIDTDNVQIRPLESLTIVVSK